jgi:hypothetical protein
MFPSERSSLARELRKPLPRPKEVTTQLYSSLPQYFNSAIAYPPWRPPVDIVSNPDLIPRLLRNFYEFCEDHPDRGNDPRRLTALQVTREDCALAALDGEFATIDFLAGGIFPSVTRALRDLEQNIGLRRTGFATKPSDGCAGIHILFQDGVASETATRAVFQAKSPKTEHDYFREMDRMAQERVDFGSQDLTYDVDGALSIILGVSFYLVYVCYRLTLAFRGPYKRTIL